MKPSRRGRWLGLSALSSAASALVGAAVASASASPLAQELYTSRAYVTGQVEPGRSEGFAKCLSDVLVKVTGDPRLLADTRLQAFAAEAGSYVTTFTYRDQMSGIPVHDEQGTRDRPYELTVTFDAAKIVGALEKLERDAWTADRPRLAVFLHVRHIASSFALTRDGAQGPGMREALAEAASGVGLPVVLPDGETLQRAGFDGKRPAEIDPAALLQEANRIGAGAVLAGTLTWSDTALGWIAEWRMAKEGRESRWHRLGVNFDEAFRAGMRGALQILAGKGEPG